MTKQEYKEKKKALKEENLERIKKEKLDYKEAKKQLKAERKLHNKEARARIDSLDEETDEKISSLKLDYKAKKKHLTPEETEQLRKQRKLPSYTQGEEIFNSVTHIVGGGFGLIGLVVGIIFSALNQPGNIMSMFSMLIFGISMVMLYTISAIYHGLHVNKGKQVFQVLDHCTIYFLIAGSYTPVVLLGLGSLSPWNHLFLLFIYFLSILGIVLNATMMRKKAVKVVSMILYLLIGWAIIGFAPTLYQSMKLGGLLLLVFGGVSYSIGSILYGVGRKKRYMHSIFHLFVNLGTLLQYLAVLLYLIIQI